MSRHDTASRVAPRGPFRKTVMNKFALHSLWSLAAVAVLAVALAWSAPFASSSPPLAGATASSFGDWIASTFPVGQAGFALRSPGARG